MRTPASWLIFPGLFAGLFFFTTEPAAGRVLVMEVEPRWLRLDIPQASLGVEVEGLSETVNARGASATHERLSLVPLLGLQTRGSIYHPNLLSFNLSGEAGWGWITDSIKSSGSSTTRTESGDLLRYQAQVSLLPTKPYNATFTAAQDHTFRNYDSFSSYTVDTTRYNGRFNWTKSSFELNADVGYRDEQSSGINGTSEITETYFNFYGIQRRHRGQSYLSYRHNEFENTVNSGSALSSVYNSVGISDTETFGSQRQIGATTSASFSQAQYTGQQTETITAGETIAIRHRPKLDSYLTVNYSHSSMRPVTSSLVQGIGGVRHQLFESLTSSADVHGTHDESSGPSGAAINDRYGVGLHENYTKRLQSWGRLSLGAGIEVNHEEHQSSGSALTTIDEPHQLYLPTSPSYPLNRAFLDKPRVIRSTIQVIGPVGIATEHTDYEVVQYGELVEIQLVFGSLLLHDGDPVTVSYQSESLNNAAFDTFTGGAQIRLDLFGKFGLYARVNWVDNNAPLLTLTEQMVDLVAGADYSWQGLRAGAEFEDHDSNFSQYQAWRFYQSYGFQPDPVSSFSVNLGQTFYQYAGNGNQSQYQFVTRYSSQLFYSLAWYAEAGYTLQEVLRTEQSYGTARTGLTWTRDKLTIRAGYQYNHQTTTSGTANEQRDRNYFFVNLKRYF